MKKRTRSNIIMVAVIVLVVCAGVFGVGKIKGWFDKPEVPTANLTGFKGIVTIERDGVAYTLREDTVLRKGDRISCGPGASVTIQAGESSMVLGGSTAVEIEEPAVEGFSAKISQGDVFADAASGMKLSFDDKEFLLENAAAQFSIRTGAQSLSVYSGTTEGIAQGTMKEWIGDSVSEREIALTSLSAFTISQLRKVNAKSQACFSDADLDELIAQREAEANAPIDIADNDTNKDTEPGKNSGKDDQPGKKDDSKDKGKKDEKQPDKSDKDSQKEPDKPADGGSEGQTPDDGGKEGQTPDDGGNEGQTPDGGNEGQTPADGGSEGQTPDDGGNEGQTPDDGGSEGQTPDDGGNEGQTPDDGGSEGQTPDDGGSGEEPGPDPGEDPGPDPGEDPNPGSGDEPSPDPGEDPDPGEEPEDPKLYCTVTIRCDTILDNWEDLKPEKEPYVPENGIILWKAKVEFTEGETAFDVLKRVCEARGIQLEYSWSPMYDSYYVEGINHLYEFDCGIESGWMYKVNGWFPNYGCSAYTMSDGEDMVWCYTCKGYGADVGGGV